MDDSGFKNIDELKLGKVLQSKQDKGVKKQPSLQRRIYEYLLEGGAPKAKKKKKKKKKTDNVDTNIAIPERILGEY